MEIISSCDQIYLFLPDMNIQVICLIFSYIPSQKKL